MGLSNKQLDELIRAFTLRGEDTRLCEYQRDLAQEAVAAFLELKACRDGKVSIPVLGRVS